MKKYYLLLILVLSVGLTHAKFEVSLLRYLNDGTLAPRNYFHIKFEDDSDLSAPSQHWRLYRKAITQGYPLVLVKDFGPRSPGDVVEYSDITYSTTDQYEYEYWMIRTYGSGGFTETSVSKPVYFRNVPEPDWDDTFSSLSGTTGVTYHGLTYDADITLVKSSNHEGVVAPVVIVDGFDPENNRDFFSTKPANTRDNRGIYHLMQGSPRTGGSGPNFLENLLEDCHDVIIVNWHEGAGDMLGNEKLLRAIIRWVNSEKEWGDLTIIGPSMGGVISRIALAQMETDGEDHQTSLFVSFDSPHYGANIPLGLQMAFLRLTNPSLCDDGDAELYALAKSKLQNPAAKQLLKYYYHEGGDEDKIGQNMQRLLFTANLYSRFGYGDIGWPQNLRKIAISNGAAAQSDFSKDAPFLRVQPRLGGLEVYPLGGPYEEVYEKNGGCGDISADLSGENYFLLDNSPGGSLDLPLQLLESFQGSEHEADLKEVNRYPSHACFIPLASAIGLQLDDVNTRNYGSMPLIHPNHTPTITTLNSKSIPFDALKLQPSNEEHVTINKGTAAWTLNEIKNATIPVNLYIPKNDGSAPTYILANGEIKTHVAKENIYFSKSTTNAFIVEPGAKHDAKAGTTIHWRPGFHVKNGGYHHSKIIPGIGECEPCTNCREISFSASNDTFNPKGRIEKSENDGYIEIFPNPSITGIVHVKIRTREASTFSHFTAFTPTGEIIYTENTSSGEATLSLGVNPGVYIIQATTNNQQFQEKLIIQ